MYDNKELTTTCIFAEILCNVFWFGDLCLPNRPLAAYKPPSPLGGGFSTL